MSSAHSFGVYTAAFPFLDSGEDKIRPVIVISQPQGRHNVIAIVPVSSRTHKEPVDVTVSAWSNAGLLKPSVARVHRLTTMLQSDLIAELGKLDDLDIDNLCSGIRAFLNL